MKKAKQILALLIAVAMTAAVVGCSPAATNGGTTSTGGGTASTGGTGTTGTTGGDKSPITIRLAGSAMYEFDPATDAIAQKIVDDFGITFENVGYEGDNEKIMLDAQGGELADVFYTSMLYDLYGFATQIDQGFVRSIPEDMLKDFPLVKAQIEGSAVAQASKDQYGEYFFIPKPDALDTSYYVGERKGIFYRKDWAEKVGITKTPTTFEELYEMAKAFTTKDPDGNGKNDTYGLTSDKFGNFRYFLAATGHSNMNWVKAPDGTWTHGALLEDNIEILEWFRKMFTEGYLDPEFGAIDHTQAMQKFASEQFGAVNRNADADWLKGVILDQFYAATKDKYENPFEIIDVIPILAKDANSDPGIDKYIDAMCNTMIASTCDDEKLRRYLEYHEYLLTEDGQLLTLGIEGVDWKKTGEKIEMILGSDGLFPKVGDKYRSLNVTTMPSWGFDFRSDPNVQTFTEFNDEIKALDAKCRAARNPYAVESDMRVKMLSDPILLDANAFKFSVEYGNIVAGTQPVDVMFKDMVSRAMAAGFTDAIKYVNDTATAKGW